jgi:hypothetical protein
MKEADPWYHQATFNRQSDNSKTQDDGGDIVTTQVQSTSINTGKEALCDQKQTYLIIPDLQYCV